MTWIGLNKVDRGWIWMGRGDLKWYWWTADNCFPSSNVARTSWQIEKLKLNLPVCILLFDLFSRYWMEQCLQADSYVKQLSKWPWQCPAEQAEAVTGFINAIIESQKVSDVTVNVWQAMAQVCVYNMYFLSFLFCLLKRGCFILTSFQTALVYLNKL